MGIVRIILLSLVFLLFVTFCVVNRQAVTVDFFPLPYLLELPLFVFALAFLALGLLVGGVGQAVKLLKAQYLIRKIQRRVASVEQENSSLRQVGSVALPGLKKTGAL